MEMDGRDRAKCGKSKLMDMICIIWFVNDNKDERVYSVILFLLKSRKENAREKNIYNELRFYSSERVSDFSLRSRAIGPSDSFGARRKAVLRGEGNVWAPVSWIFDKLHEVGVLSDLKLHFV